MGYPWMVILVDDMREGGGWALAVPGVWVRVVVEEEERAEAGMTLETTEETVERSTVVVSFGGSSASGWILRGGEG